MGLGWRERGPAQPPPPPRGCSLCPDRQARGQERAGARDGLHLSCTRPPSRAPPSSQPSRPPGSGLLPQTQQRRLSEATVLWVSSSKPSPGWCPPTLGASTAFPDLLLLSPPEKLQPAQVPARHPLTPHSEARERCPWGSPDTWGDHSDPLGAREELRPHCSLGGCRLGPSSEGGGPQSGPWATAVSDLSEPPGPGPGPPFAQHPPPSTGTLGHWVPPAKPCPAQPCQHRWAGTSSPSGLLLAADPARGGAACSGWGRRHSSAGAVGTPPFPRETAPGSQPCCPEKPAKKTWGA